MADQSSASELLTQQFYNWEIRGRGWFAAAVPVRLEPPFRPFEGHVLPPEFFQDDGREGSFLTAISDRLRGLFGPPAPPQDDLIIEEPHPEIFDLAETEQLVELQLSLPEGAQPSADVFEQCIFTLAYCRAAVGFEVIGTKDTLTVQVVARSDDAESVFAQLKSHFPEAVVNPSPNLLPKLFVSFEGPHVDIREFGLEREFMLPLRMSRDLALDPMVALCGALEQLRTGECAVFQILFEPTRNNWADQAWSALTTGAGDAFFQGEKEMLALAKRKFASPLFAVVLRVAAVAASEDRIWEIIRGLSGAVRLFDSPEGNRLALLENDDYELYDHLFDFLNRCSRRCGMLLSSDELTSIAHLPTAAVRSRKLAREIKRTKAVPEALTKEGVVLGINRFEGRENAVRLPEVSRTEHMHVIGTQGTGKSTLLLSLICQDIYAGRGIAVLDPHGDLVNEVLELIPPERYDDVIIVDPADDRHPIGFNILSAHSTLEKNLLASDLVAVFKRLSTSWGDQMNSVLGNAVLAFLENTRVGTLPELRRFFVEPGFRKEVLQTVTDADIAYYWEKEFPIVKSNSLGPLLTRLDMFLRPKSIRYMVGQKENKLDFAHIMNEGKIVLARLSQGLIGEENSFLLGALLVSKFHQLAISRQADNAADRKPYFLYLDEFHHFVTPSMAAILSGVRKYRLGLILAHQTLTQLKDSDVANAVLSSPYTRICFRLGDQDAKRVAESFSFFGPSDILNLELGEAICRVQKNDWDFNLQTILPEKPNSEEAERRRSQLQELSRSRYGAPREKVEEELARNRVEIAAERVDPFKKRTSEGTDAVPKAAQEEKQIVISAAPLAKVPPSPAPVKIEKSGDAQGKPKTTKNEGNELGRGGAQFGEIKRRIKEAAARLGFGLEEESKSVKMKGDADLAIFDAGKPKMAVEIGIETTVDQEMANVLKCLNSTVPLVVVVMPSSAKLQKMKDSLAATLPSEAQERVKCLEPDEFIAFLGQIPREQLPSLAPSERVSGKYKVTRSVPKLTAEENRRAETEAQRRLAGTFKAVKTDQPKRE